MARNANTADASEAARPGGARKSRSLEKLSGFMVRAEEHDPGLGVARESAAGSLTAAWDASQAGIGQATPLFPRWLGRLGYYGLALLLVAIAATVRWALAEVLSPAPILVFYLAWVAAAAFGGLGPGLLATLASWLCIDFLFDPTPGLIGFDDSSSVIRLLICLAGGLAVSVAGEKMRRSRIHERRQGQVLRASEEKYRFLVENSKDITWTIDLQGKWTFVSSNVEKVIGYRADEIIGKTLWDLLAPESHDFAKERLRRRMNGEDLPPGEVLVVGKDGRSTPFELHAAPIVDGGGNIVGVQGVSRDITERKRSEETLRQSEASLAKAQAIAHLGNWEVDARTGRVRGSNELYRLFNLEPDVPLDAYIEKFHPEDRQRVVESINAAVREGRPYSFDYRVVPSPGPIRYVHAEGEVTCDNNGLPIIFFGTVQDITERKRAEEAVAESRKRYRGLVEKINDWVWEIDADCVYTYSSPRALELLGYLPEEIVGKTPFDLMSPAEARRVRDAFHPVYLERKPLELLENTLVRKDGNLVTVETSGMPVFAEDGAFLGYTGIDRDVTSRKRAEEALRESEEKFRLLAETSPAAILIYQDDKYVYANPAVESITGYKRSELLQQVPWDIVHPEHRQQVEELASRRAQGEVLPTRYETKMLTKDGQERWTDNSSVSIIYGNKPAGLVVAFDITQRKKAEEALRELNATLESKVAQRTAELEDRARQLQKLTLDLTEAENRERKRLAEILHDDLQQILAAAKFHLAIVSERCKDDETSQEMTEQVRQMLVEAIGKSRGLSHELNPPGLAHSDLRETFEWLADQMQTKHGLAVHVEVGDQIVLQSEPLKTLLFKAAQEMLFNVIKHAQVREARLQLRRRRGNICLAVSDTGRGFDPQETGKTTGFGLPSLCERVNLLGGRMKVRSAKGKGSTFLIVVPETPP